MTMDDEHELATSDRLAAELKKYNGPQWMVDKARAGYYDDFKSHLTFPITTLVEDLTRYGLFDLAERAKNGEFDATREESEAWAKSEEGQQAIRDLLGH
jgi:hypothetical protein